MAPVPLVPLKSKLCRMLLTSRMVITEDQQKIVCEGKLANYMDYCPDWVKSRDDTTKNWMDIDNKMTENIALAHCIGSQYFLMPDDPAMGELAEKVEKLLYGIMNTMCYLINKICFAPNNTLPGGTDFDPEYAQQRFMKKYKNFAFKLEEILEGPFIMGDTLPIYADYLLYACLCDMKVFVPQYFSDGQFPKITKFMDHFLNYRSPIRRWFKSNASKEGEYVRAPVPSIFELLPEDMH